MEDAWQRQPVGGINYARPLMFTRHPSQFLDLFRLAVNLPCFGTTIYYRTALRSFLRSPPPFSPFDLCSFPISFFPQYVSFWV